MHEHSDSEAVTVRLLSQNDDLEELTDLLHRAFKRHEDRGISFLAAYQDVEVTRARVSTATCFVAEHNGRLVGTICVGTSKGGCAWYENDRVHVAAQLAVSPDLQGKGIGAKLLRAAENAAREKGAIELALDTSVHADDLIGFYLRQGYRRVDVIRYAKQPHYNVVLSKPLLDGVSVEVSFAKKARWWWKRRMDALRRLKRQILSRST